MNERKEVGWVGVILILLAIAFFLGALLLQKPFEPLLIFGVILLLPIGVYLVAEGRKTAMARERLLEIRRIGPGKPGDIDARKDWIDAQTQRARSIRITVLAVIFGSLALYLSTHVTGTVWLDNESKEKKAAQKEETPGLRWRTHAERLANTGDPTLKDATLAQIALANGITVTELARANPAARLEIREDLQSVIAEGRNLRKLKLIQPEGPDAEPGAPAGAPPGAEPPVPDANKPAEPTDTPSVITLEAAAHQLKITPEQVAVEFPTAVLVTGQQPRIPVRTSADPLQWYDWFLWALIGLAASLLIEIGRHTRLIFEGEGDFLGETPWYWAQLTTGPLIAFAILLLFTHIDLDLLTGDEAAAAVEVNLHRYPIDLLIVPAFLLGFYSMVAREVLDQLMRAIFRGAWRAVYGGADFKVAIRDRNGDDEIDSRVAFETRPPVPVVWSATAGAIDNAGIFQPPPVDKLTEVFITAIPTAGGSGAVTRKFSLIKHKFAIVHPKDREILPGQKAKLKIAPVPADEGTKVTWRVVDHPDSTIGNSGFEVELEVPAGRPVGEIVKVEATYAGLSRSVDLTVGKPPTPPAPGGGSAPAGGAPPGN